MDNETVENEHIEDVPAVEETETETETETPTEETPTEEVAPVTPRFKRDDIVINNNKLNRIGQVNTELNVYVLVTGDGEAEAVDISKFDETGILKKDPIPVSISISDAYEDVLNIQSTSVNGVDTPNTRLVFDSTDGNSNVIMEFTEDAVRTIYNTLGEWLDSFM